MKQYNILGGNKQKQKKMNYKELETDMIKVCKRHKQYNRRGKRYDRR